MTISPSLSLYRMVVLPAASKPTIRIRISFFPKRFLKRPANMFPMVADLREKAKEKQKDDRFKKKKPELINQK